MTSVMDGSAEVARRATCPDCAVVQGARHQQTCGTARCEATGLRYLDCACPSPPAGPVGLPNDHQIDVWTGVWKMEEDCRALGWFLMWDPEREEFLRCTPNEPGAGPDIDRLTTYARWNRQIGHWERRTAVLYTRQVRRESELVLLRRWAVDEGYRILHEYNDDRRVGAGLKLAIDAVASGLAEAVLVVDQRDFGSSGKVRHAQMERIRAAGGFVRSMALWDGGAAPASYAERRRADAEVAFGPPSEDPDDTEEHMWRSIETTNVVAVADGEAVL